MQREAQHREQARENLQEAQIRAARADKEQALAEEQAAAARREMAEVQERAALAEQQARERAARAGEDRTAAEELRAEAQRLAPGLTPDGQHPHHDSPEGGATRR
ncbi:hypothetical protein DQ244_04805 [Blastococcus sp. TBT05-19]|nr:hypothetical protein DQ244_04805 [Blastococcus sp. TBT05-19]